MKGSEGGLYMDLGLPRELAFTADWPVISGNPVLNIGASGVQLKKDNQVIHNQDWREQEGIDLVFDLTKPWPVRSNTYGIISAFHVLEHIPVHQVLQVVQEAHRCVCVNGYFVVECPDIDGLTKSLQSGNHGMLECIYGLDRHPGDNHRWGYTRSSMQLLLTIAGFGRTWTGDPLCYHREQQSCLRAVGVKQIASPEEILDDDRA